MSVGSMRGYQRRSATLHRATSAVVGQNTARSRFELEIDGHIAFANYRITDGVVAITYTETPPALALRERGVGSQLVLGARGRRRD
jgi:hypothetical protein